MIGRKVGAKAIVWETNDIRVTIYYYPGVFNNIISSGINGILIEKRKWVDEE